MKRISPGFPAAGEQGDAAGGKSGTWDTATARARKRRLTDGGVTPPNHLPEMFDGISQKTLVGHEGCGSLCLSFPPGPVRLDIAALLMGTCLHMQGDVMRRPLNPATTTVVWPQWSPLPIPQPPDSLP